MQVDNVARKHLKLGEILVHAGILSEERLGVALKEQKTSGERLGFILISRRVISEAQLVQALSKQLSVPWVSLTHLDITSELQRLVPVQVVSQHGVIPVYIMSKRPGEKVLYVAMDDPTNEDVLNQIRQTSGLDVKPMIAAPSEIASAIARFFRLSWATGERLRESLRAKQAPAATPAPGPSQAAPEETPLEAAPVEAAPVEAAPVEAAPVETAPAETAPAETAPAETAPAEPAAVEPPAPAAEAPADDAFVLPESAAIEEAAQASPDERPEGPPPEKKAARRPSKGISFTFLDGTSISFASQGPLIDTEVPHEVDMIRRIGDLIAQDGGGPRLSAAVASVIEILFKRGLVTHEEIRTILDKLEVK
jgi:type IV pilus assembly protein PilB